MPQRLAYISITNRTHTAIPTRRVFPGCWCQALPNRRYHFRYIPFLCAMFPRRFVQE
jgi:hypothetical protein